MADRRPRSLSRAWRCSHRCRVEYHGLDASRVRPRRRPRPASAACSWSTSSPTPTPPARDTPSAGRTCRSCWRQASTSTPPSTSSTSRASTTSSPGSPACRCGRRCPTRSSTRPTRSRWWICLPGELVERLHQGKVYIPDQAERAVQSFFTRPNLGALREITLRRTADRVHAHLETARLASAGPQQTWATSETLLVCVGPSPTSAKVIRTSKRLAASLGARWIAVSVESSRRGSRRRLASATAASEERPTGRTPGGGDGHHRRRRHRARRSSASPTRRTSPRSPSARRPNRVGSACDVRTS